MNRQRLTLRLSAGDVPKAEALLSLAGAETIALRDAADDPVFEPAPSTAPLWPQVTLEALFDAAANLEPLRGVLASTFPDTGVTIESLEDAEWRAKLPQPIAARAIGTRLWLAPADDSVGPHDRATVRLNMGLAFGTGEHPTTALCLEWLERHVSAGSTLIDYGCGSGVLALAALTLGARSAYAVDDDSQALLATRQNAALNGLAARLFVGTPEQLPAVAVDVLAANILAGPLVELAPLFAERLLPGGGLVLSGILQAQAASVATAYAPYFEDLEQTARGGWVRIAARRKAG